MVAGGGFKVGSGDRRNRLARRPRQRATPYTPSNVLANLYQHLGIDPAITIPDHDKRPMYVLDDREPVRELVD